MGKTRFISIISSFGIIGFLIACILAPPKSEADFFIKRSLNCLMTRLLLHLFCFIFRFLFYPDKIDAIFNSSLNGSNTLVFFVTLFIYIHLIILWVKVLIANITLSKRNIWGLIKVF